jgi:hypothetical protein
VSRDRLQPYVLVRNGRIETKAMLDPDHLPTNLPSGLTLMTESAAALQGLTQGDPADDTDDDLSRAKTAILLDALAYRRAATIGDNADSVAGGSGAVTLAQLTATVRLLASWIAVLCRHDVMVQRELMALILRDPANFGGIGTVPTTAVTISPTPAEATASGGTA